MTPRSRPTPGTAHGERTSDPVRPTSEALEGLSALRSLLGEGVWRWRWDLNPRWSYPHTRFRGVLLRPLGHATAGKATGAAAPRRNRAAGRAHSSCADPADHLDAVVRARVAGHVPDRAAGPGLGVEGAEHAYRHAGQHHRPGAHDARLERDDEGAADRAARTPAPGPPRGSRRSPRGRSGPPSASRTLCPSPMTSPSGPTTTAPTGTSPACSADGGQLERAGHPRGVPDRRARAKFPACACTSPTTRSSRTS